MFALMIFMLCFFVGFSLIFFYLFRQQEKFYRQLCDDHAQLRVLLRAAESRLDYLLEKTQNSKESAIDSDSTIPDMDGDSGLRMDEQHDPLLHLSFEEPSLTQEKDCNKLDIHIDPPAAPETQKKR